MQQFLIVAYFHLNKKYNQRSYGPENAHLRFGNSKMPLGRGHFGQGQYNLDHINSLTKGNVFYLAMFKLEVTNPYKIPLLTLLLSSDHAVKKVKVNPRS